jgi:hypothetical protein
VSDKKDRVDERFLPAISSEKEVNCVVVHFDFVLKVAIDHLAYGCGSV